MELAVNPALVVMVRVNTYVPAVVGVPVRVRLLVLVLWDILLRLLPKLVPGGRFPSRDTVFRSALMVVTLYIWVVGWFKAMVVVWLLDVGAWKPVTLSLNVSAVPLPSWAVMMADNGVLLVSVD